ncbi:MAG: hypothetical protein RIF39_17995, partial [Cyclobacteriaceae bacterium]
MLSRVIAKLKINWGYDPFEKEILANANIRKSKSESKLFIQIPADYYYFSLYTQVIKKFIAESDCEIVGIWPTIFTLRLKHDLLFPIRLWYDILNYYLIRRKWIRLYRAIGVNKVVTLDRAGLASKLAFWIRAYNIWKGVRTKQDIIDITIDGIYCGDLIYDSYLRYRIRPTAKVKSVTMLYYIYKAHVVLQSARLLSCEKNVVAFFSSYSTYIQHGIPARVLLQKGLIVYTYGNFQQRFKKLTPGDYFHTANHSNYKNQFDELANRKERIVEGTAALEKKLSGVIDKATGYMKASSFGSGTA